jgi:hypothetical protein
MEGKALSTEREIVSRMDDSPVCVVHVGEDGGINFHLDGDVAFFIVDERKPHDRVYRLTMRTPREQIAELLGASEVGSCDDARSKAIEHRIRSALLGKSHLAVVDDGS